MSIEKMNDHYSLTNPASQYDEESLTALELAGRTAAKMNETVEQFNTLEKNTNDHLKAQDEAIPVKVRNEVQSQIENGTFDDQIDKHTEALIDAIEEAEQELEQDVANLGTRLDNLLGQVVEGTSTMDAEVIDARVSPTGKVYNNLGSALRGELSVMAGYPQNIVYVGAEAHAKIVNGGGGTLKLTIPSEIYAYFKNNFYVIPVIIQGAEIASKITDNGNGTVTIEIPSHSNLVYDTINKKLCFRQHGVINYGEIVALQNMYATPVSGTLLLEMLGYFRMTEYPAITAKSDANDKNLKYCGLGYMGYGQTIKTALGSDGGYKITFPQKITVIVDGGIYVYGDWEKDFTDIGDKLVTNADGTHTITIPSHYIFVYDKTNKKFCFRARESIQITDIILLWNLFGKLVDGTLLKEYFWDRDQSIEGRVKALESASPVAISDEVKGKCSEFNALFKGSEEVESFLFFTDPHFVDMDQQWYTGEWEDRMNTFIQTAKMAHDNTATDLVVSGGDWLNSYDTPEEACYALGRIHAQMRANFKDFYLLVGNHDTNYQGDEQLSEKTIANLWYRDQGKAYYKHSGKNTDFYFFDTGLDTNRALTEYDAEQVKWFIETLKTSTADHIAIGMHIINNSTYDGSGAYYQTNFAKAITAAAKAFNERGTHEFSGQTYNFSGATGRVEFMFGGHMHQDQTDILNDIPFFLTRNMYDGENPSFDLCFADYTNRVVRLKRIGNGDDRTISI